MLPTALTHPPRQQISTEIPPPLRQLAHIFQFNAIHPIFSDTHTQQVTMIIQKHVRNKYLTNLLTDIDSTLLSSPLSSYSSLSSSPPVSVTAISWESSRGSAVNSLERGSMSEVAGVANCDTPPVTLHPVI